MFRRASFVLMLLAIPLFAAGTAKSGPQVGQKMPGPFEPLNVTGPDAGKKSCLYCRNSFHPVVMIFARKSSPELVALLERLDAATAAHGDASMGSCAIFCNDSEGLPGQLEQMAKQNNLSSDNPGNLRCRWPLALQDCPRCRCYRSALQPLHRESQSFLQEGRVHRSEHRADLGRPSSHPDARMTKPTVALFSKGGLMRQPGAHSSMRARGLWILFAGMVFCGCEAFKQTLSDHLTHWNMLDQKALEDPIKAVGGDGIVFSSTQDTRRRAGSNWQLRLRKPW